MVPAMRMVRRTATTIVAAPALELVDIETGSCGVEVLQGASLSVGHGELVGLCGENGGGRSTLLRIVEGAQPFGSYRGQLRVAGRELKLASPADARREGIAVIRQKPPLVPRMSVAHNLMLGREPHRYGLVDAARLEAVARSYIQYFGFAERIDLTASVADVGMGWRQIVEIMRALLAKADLLVLEEPAAVLAPNEKDRLFALLRMLQTEGVTCLYVSDRLDEAAALCDRVVVVRDGKTADTSTGETASASSSGNRYAVHSRIGSGGMATVHVGKMLGPFGFTRTVAVKRLRAAFSKDPEFVAMFLDEARLASRVRHPNVVPVLDVFAQEGELSLVMEYVDGESLSQLVRFAHEKAAPIPVAIAVAIVVSVLHGLHAAHEACDEQGAPLGLVHRDVSPQNVLVGTDGVVRVIDFGIAKATGRFNVSRENHLKGKLPYMAPEQIRHGIVNRQTDIYGASVLLWELLVGERLFDGSSEGMILARVLDDEVLPPSAFQSDVPSRLDAITLRGLARAQALRFESARAMARELEKIGRVATTGEISDWVQELAAGPIAMRRRSLARLEGDSLGPQPRGARGIAEEVRPGETEVTVKDASVGGRWRPTVVRLLLEAADWLRAKGASPLARARSRVP